MTNSYNYRHLYYFWVVAKEGSMSKAAGRLNMAIQTSARNSINLKNRWGICFLNLQDAALP